MAISDLLDSLDDEIKIIHSSEFDIDITGTNYVPNDNDSSLTFENFDEKYKKVKTIETCVLFIDIRKSTSLNLQHYPATMAKLYSSFIRSMIKASEHFGGKIRNIVGDRLMVVFDSNNCFSNSVKTAFLMNTIAQKVINKRFSNNDFSCGIGIDYGKMMVTKCGTIKQGVENSNYKSLVWLGKPANIASKLTDIANKPSTQYKESGVKVGLYYPYTDKWSWIFENIKTFEKNIEFSASPNMKYKNEYFRTFFASSEFKSNYDSTKPILISESVYKGYKNECPDDNSIVNKWWSKTSRKIDDYSGEIYQADVTYTW